MKITPIIASKFASDGGAMFGLVPQPIWSKRLEPDDRNRIPQHANVLLIELNDGRLGLIDTGCGDPSLFSDKERAVHGLSDDWPLRDTLAERGIDPAHLDFVIFTHLHWDHAGGAHAQRDGSPHPHFPNAVHFIHEQEWAEAISGNPLLYKSYPPGVIAPLRALPLEQRSLVRDDAPEILPGIRLLRSSGHTRGHCVVELADDAPIVCDHPHADQLDELTLCVYAGDVCPTQHHLRMVFQTAYDTFPLDTRKWKQEWLPRIADSDTALFFDHDPTDFAALIRADKRTEYAVTARLPARPSAR